MALDQRPNRALQLCLEHRSIRKIDNNTYRVRSQSGHGSYLVINQDGEWRCECPDFLNRTTSCKHVLAISLNNQLKDLKGKFGNDLLPDLPSDNKPDKCIYCDSTELLQRGSRSTHGKVKRYSCKKCGKWFTLREDGFHRMRNDPRIITLCLDAYYKGMSFRDIVDHVKQFYGVRITHVSVMKWVGKFMRMLAAYHDSLEPIVGDTWNVDEMTVYIDGKKHWLWNVLDKKTRFQLATTISKKRDLQDARTPLRKAKEMAKVRPRYVVTDGLKAYPDAIQKELGTLANPKTKHVRLPSIREHPNNNAVERLHGTIRERAKVMRGLKNEDSPILRGHRIYYNLIREHMGLNGKIPMQEAGHKMKFNGNRWLELIKKAVEQEKQQSTKDL